MDLYLICPKLGSGYAVEEVTVKIINILPIVMELNHNNWDALHEAVSYPIIDKSLKLST
jgi:hypothetical protein